MDTLFPVALLALVVLFIASQAAQHLEQTKKRPGGESGREFDPATTDERWLRWNANAMERGGASAEVAWALAVAQSPLRKGHPPASTELQSGARMIARNFRSRVTSDDDLDEFIRAGRIALAELAEAADSYGDRYYRALWADAYEKLVDEDLDELP